MNKYLKAFLSAGGVLVLAVIFLLVGWGFFKGLGIGLGIWLVSAIISAVKGGN